MSRASASGPHQRFVTRLRVGVNFVLVDFFLRQHHEITSTIPAISSDAIRRSAMVSIESETRKFVFTFLQIFAPKISDSSFTEARPSRRIRGVPTTLSRSLQARNVESYRCQSSR